MHYLRTSVKGEQKAEIDRLIQIYRLMYMKQVF